jgi:hypothetical protein
MVVELPHNYKAIIESILSPIETKWHKLIEECNEPDDMKELYRQLVQSEANKIRKGFFLTPDMEKRCT